MALIDVPKAGQTLGNTRVDINQNFSVIGSTFAVDHVGYNDIGQGKHNKVTMPVQSADPVTAASELALYSKTVSGVPALVLRQQSSGAITDFTTAGKTTAGWTRLPSGILLKWNYGVAFSGASYDLIINTSTNVPGSPAFTSMFNVQISFIYPASTITADGHKTGLLNITSPNFTVRKFGGSFPPNTVSIAYLAIGI